MSERFPSTTELRQRSSLVIEGLQQAQENGLSIDEVRRFHTNNLRPHQDMFLVLLGLKPFAGYLGAVFEIYQPNQKTDYLTPIARHVNPDTMVSKPNYSIWNPSLVDTILAENFDLVTRLDNTTLQTIPMPGEPAFGAFMKGLIRNKSETTIRIEGLVYGFPRKATEFTIQSDPQIRQLISELKTDLAIRKIESIASGVYSPHELLTNANGLRDEVLSLGTRLRLSRKKLAALTSSVDADVPGFPYITAKDLTAAEESELRDAYANSEMEQKLEQFLETA